MWEFSFSRPIAILPLISALSMLGTIIYYFLKAKKSALAYHFILTLLIGLIWPIGQTVQYCAASEKVVFLADFLNQTSSLFIGLAWLLFVKHFISDGKFTLSKEIPLIIFPVIAYLIFLTNSCHHLYYTEISYDPGTIIYRSIAPFFGFAVLVDYIYGVIAIFILIRHIKYQKGVTRGQAIILIFTPLASFIASIIFFLQIIFISGLKIHDLFDPTPTLYTFSMILLSIAVYKYRFLDISQGAFKKVFINLHDSILIIDNYNYIVNFNDSFIKNFGYYNINDSIASFIKKLEKAILITEESKRILKCIEFGSTNSTEIGEFFIGEKIYEVIIQKIDYHRNIYQGRIITFHDITENKKLLAAVKFKNQELAKTNQLLKEHLQTVEELAIANERNRVVREIHDTLGHSLTLLILLMKAAKIETGKNSAGANEKLAEGIKVAQTELNELRTSIGGLLSKDVIVMDIFESINSLGQYMETLGIHLKFSVTGKNIYTGMPSSVYKFKLSNAIYKICKEAVTNALRHGKAAEINIIIKFSPQKVNLFIIDNGRGCLNIIKGFGLSGMKERVEELNGMIKFGSDGESGFNINVEAPLEVKSNG
jgi:signal transduction histidine kinase